VEPSSKTRHKATQSASHAGTVSSELTCLSTLSSCKRKGSLSVKRLKSFRFPEPPCKPGVYGMTPSIYVPMSPSSFTKVPDSLSYTGS